MVTVGPDSLCSGVLVCPCGELVVIPYPGAEEAFSSVRSGSSTNPDIQCFPRDLKSSRVDDAVIRIF